MWQPISLKFKNEFFDSEHEAFGPVTQTHNLMRVMESVRKNPGEGRSAEEAIGDFYTELGRRIHHDKALDFTAAEALAAVGLDESHAAAYDDEAWDAEIRTRMDEGIALVGDDVGTPIIAIDGDHGERVGLFGPVISKMPEGEHRLALWDGLVAMVNTPGFWELKRTRTEGPQFGPRP